MSEFTILRRVRLGAHHKPTGKTRHYHGIDELPSPAELIIARYTNGVGFYLLYCNSNGEELTDTYHDTLEQAMYQAEWEFSVKQDDWDVIEAA